MKTIDRRTLLRGMGVSIAAPLLESMGAEPVVPIRRFVAVNIPLGFYPPKFFPSAAGAGYETSEYLKPADHLRDSFTVISGVSHPGVDGGHSAEKSFLTAAPHPAERGFKNSISLDQVIAKEVGAATRFASLSTGEKTLSYTENGVAIPQESSPAKLFEKLFFSGTNQEISRQKQQLADGHSIIDSVLDEARAMQKTVSRVDKEKLDQFFTAVRESEQQLRKSEKWLDTPKPQVDSPKPPDLHPVQVDQWLKAHFEVNRLALMTDSTRVIALGGAGHGSVVPLPGVSMGYHGLTHHGKNPDMLRQLEIIERATIQVWVGFLESLRDTPDGEGSLLDHTQVLLGSNLGNASGHITTNLPVLLAGGGYRHGQHLAFDPKNNYPLPNLYVSILQNMGLEIDRFATGNGTMSGLV
ncbi:MAG: DUF1552 domain-containing protein [Verrucomicrobiales bacterium]|nr:DUF1552 domain-containing protein [Verrucomicrobiales bacterium]